MQLIIKLYNSKLRLYLLIVFLSFLPLVSIFIKSDLFHSHDGLVHLPRLASFYKALTDGQIPIRWAGDLNYGYGMPLFNFIYHLPYLVGSVFLFLGFNLASSFKLAISLSYILSAIFMFAFTKSFFKDDKKAFLVTVFYQFAVFRLIEVLVRGSFGEVYTYTFLPLVLFGLTNIFKNINTLEKQNKNGKIFDISSWIKAFLILPSVFKEMNLKYFAITSISVALLIISHNALSMVFFIISVLFLLFFSENKKAFLVGSLALIFGLLLSSYYWVPAIFEHKYTYGDLFMKDLYLNNFPSVQKFFIPEFNNSSNLKEGGVSFQIGLFHTIALILSIIIIFRKKIDYSLKKLIVFCNLIFIISLFIMQPSSIFIWEKISFLRQFQFPWRLLGIEVFATSMLAVIFMSIPIFKKPFFYFALIFLVTSSSIMFWKPVLGYDQINEKYYWNFPLNTTYFGETDVIWAQGPFKSYPIRRVDIIAGKGEISNFSKKSNLHVFEINAKTQVNIVDRTQYFPGWRAYVDNIQVPIEFQDQNWRGQITFKVPEGKHIIKVVFAESRIRTIADIVSLTALISLVLLFFVKRFNIRKLTQ